MHTGVPGPCATCLEGSDVQGRGALREEAVEAGERHHEESATLQDPAGGRGEDTLVRKEVADERRGECSDHDRDPHPVRMAHDRGDPREAGEVRQPEPGRDLQRQRDQQQGRERARTGIDDMYR